MSNPMIEIDTISMTSGEYPEVTGRLVSGDLSNIATNRTISLNDYANSMSTRTYPYDSITTIGDSYPYNGWHSNGSGSVTIYGDLDVRGKIKTQQGDVNTIEMDEEDIIMLTFDPEQYDIDECQQIFQMWQNNFPNHKIIATFKGIKIDLIKDKGNKKKEVSW